MNKKYDLSHIFLKLGIALSFFVFLPGQSLRDRRVTPPEFDPTMFRFDHPKSLSMAEDRMLYYTAIGIAFLVIILLLIYYQYRKTQQIKLIQYKEKKFQLNKYLHQLQLRANDYKLLERIAGTSNPLKLFPLVESVKKFEQEVKKFKRKEKDRSIIADIYLLRHKLKFDFKNEQAPFISTRMLPRHMKIECALPGKKAPILFMSSILAIAENAILLKPPTISGKSVDLMKFPYITCKIRRERGANYRFKLPIVKQLSGKINAVVTEHTHKIKKLIIRETQRIPIEIPTLFNIVPEDCLYNYSGKYRDLRKTITLPTFKGIITDLSTGGCKIIIPTLPDELQADSLLTFELKDAGLSDGLLVRVINQTKDNQDVELHLQFFHLRQLTSLKINKYLYHLKKKSAKSSNNKTNPPIKSFSPKSSGI